MIPATKFPIRFAAVALVLWTGATAALADGITVRRVSPLAAPKGAGAPSAGVMTADERRALASRAARTREFLPLQKAIFDAVPGADRSIRASRRRGWTPAPGWEPPAAAAEARLRGEAARLDTTHDDINIAFIRIDFLHDRGGDKSTGDGRFDLSGPDSNAVPIDRAPHDYAYCAAHGTALERYYDIQSYGHERLHVDVWPDASEPDSAYHMSDMADLGPWAFGNSVYRSAVSMLRGMFFAADTQSTARGKRIPWDHYDRFVFIHAGSDLQSDLKQDSKEDIPTFTVFLGDTDRVIFRDSTEWRRDNPIDRAAVIPETINQDGYYGAINGVMAHENGHNLFGYLDVYDIESGYPVCGYWSLMDSGNLAGSRVLLKDGSEIYAVGILPPSIDPLQRGWMNNPGMDLRDVTWGDTLSISANETANVFYKVPLSSDEYLLLENRYLAPGDSLLQLDSDSTTKVILGVKQPDRHQVDALEPGGGILVWHVDDSVVPYTWALRPNPDYGLNSNWARQGLQVIQASGLDDLGDAGSPYMLGSPLDPWQKRINPVLADSTRPNLLPNQRTRPHVRLDFLDNADSTMRFIARRAWQLPGFPVAASFPEGGPKPLAIDADGDRKLEICWAGGRDSVNADSAGVYAVRTDGHGLWGGPVAFAHLARRPRPEMAAVLGPGSDAVTGQGPAVFALTTCSYSAADTAGGKVFLIDAHGANLPGWPVRLPAAATTPPVIVGTWPAITVFAGAADGYVYALGPDGTRYGRTDVALAGGVAGTLAFDSNAGGVGSPAAANPAYPLPAGVLAAGGANGRVAIFVGASLAHTALWTQRSGGTAFVPDFLWLHLAGTGASAENDCAGAPALVVHDLDRLWAYCGDTGAPLRGWGQSLGDTIVAGLGAGDADGDGQPEVLVQTAGSKVAFVNRDGAPSPGWPRASTSENLRHGTPALALDLDGDGRCEVVSLNGSGMLGALRSDGRTLDGWPLATGSGAAGSLLAADLAHSGGLDVVAPDRDSLLYVYTLPSAMPAGTAASWTMLGGDPGRTCSLPLARTPSAAAPSAGPLVPGTLMAFPNPARRVPVSFAYTLTEEADVDVRVVDVSGHVVASFTRHGLRAENRETWDPAGLPAGLYMAHLSFHGAHGTRTGIVPVGVLR